MTTPLTADRLTPMFRSRFGHIYRHSVHCRSTQDEFLADDPEGTIAVCEAQTAGRGRRGNAWGAPDGRALLVSVLLKPDGRRASSQIALVAGVVVAALVEREIRAPAGIKWPNDVLVERAKIAGILAEQRDEAVVLGIGINVNQSAPELPDGASLASTSLHVASGRTFDRAELLCALAHDLELAYEAWQDDGLLAVSPELAARDALLGEQLRVGDVAGVGAGIAEDGSLRIDTPTGRVSVVAGEVAVAW